MNKKGIFNPWLLIPIVVIIIILVGVVLVKNASGELESRIPQRAGCDAGPIYVTMNGYIEVRDVVLVGVKAEIKNIVITQITDSEGRNLFNMVPLRGFTAQNYNWEVSLYSTKTGNRVAIDKGKGLHPGGKVINQDEFVLTFKVPDNDCNGVIDDFDAKLMGKVTTDDAEISELDKRVAFRNGKFVLG